MAAEDFINGKYYVEISFGDEEISYAAGRNYQELSNQPSWFDASWNWFLETVDKNWIAGVIERVD